MDENKVPDRTKLFDDKTWAAIFGVKTPFSPKEIKKFIDPEATLHDFEVKEV